ncbi:isoprenylcysteine carboxylmethyltransferase family protein [Shouchella sp. JSM 1781072]|uniref:methyltransferase family protein n=1 Tax=Bacillaceae TaxID=186817 RepID=UPI00159BBF34|nr:MULTISPECIES: isoprenylcysteine carboxylmethyltransferase family protein [Bacillaceae]UTR06450.1 isoprenylcysteine carboxylmethyltransferase family protein [Alkalihalobacillus sp. LMS6]
MPWVEVLFICLTVLWVSEFFLFRGKRADDEKKEQRENRSFYLIFSCVVICICACILLQYLEWTRIDAPFISIAGVVIYSAGIGLRYWSMFLLRKQFSRHVQTSSTMKLVSNGPYRVMRHPLYTGLFLCVLGVAIYTATVIGVLVTLVVMLSVLLKRIHLEEKMLTATLPNHYETWKQSRWILFPWVY